jgi:CrcB protein
MEILKLSILVGVGGFFGTSLRFITTALVEKLIPISTFPLGTFFVNIIGCLCIGIFTIFIYSSQLDSWAVIPHSLHLPMKPNYLFRMGK